MESLSACRLVSVLSIEKLNISDILFQLTGEENGFYWPYYCILLLEGIKKNIRYCIHILTVKYAVVTCSSNHSITCGFSGSNVLQTLQFLQKVATESWTSSFRVMKNSIIHYEAPIHTWVVLQYFHSDDHSDDLHAAEIELGLLTVSAVQLKHWSQMHGGLVHLQITRLKLATDVGERFVVAITRDLLSVSFLQS